MMKKLLVLMTIAFVTVFCGPTKAATDSTKTSLFSEDKLKAELGLSSSNLFRGVTLGESPSINMKGAWVPCKWVEFGVNGTATLNGNKGCGNEINWYATFNPFVTATNELKNVTLTSEDYFYFDANDDNNANYWFPAKEKNAHFVEARLNYDATVHFTAAYTYMANPNATVKGIYFEGGYDLSPALKLTAGYLTDQNDMMFQAKGGRTNIGATVKTKLHIGSYSPTLKTSIVACPNYKNTYPVVGHNPVALVAALTF